MRGILLTTGLATMFAMVVKCQEDENKKSPQKVLSKASRSFSAYMEDKAVAIA